MRPRQMNAEAHKALQSSSESLSWLLAQFEIVEGPGQEPDALDRSGAQTHNMNNVRLDSGRPPLPQRRTDENWQDSDPQSSKVKHIRQDMRPLPAQPQQSNQPPRTPVKGTTSLLPRAIRDWGHALVSPPVSHTQRQSGYTSLMGLHESLSLESLDTLSSGQESPERSQNAAPESVPLALFYREPSIASQASDAHSSSPANFSPQTSATFPQPVENRFQETEAAQEPATDMARSTPTGQESQPQQSDSATMDQLGGGDAPEIDRAVSGLTNSAASRASTPDPQHSSTGSPLRNSLRPEDGSVPALESPFKAMAQSRSTYSFSNSCSPLDTNSTPKSASDYGSCNYSDRDGLPGAQQHHAALHHNVHQTFYAAGKQVTSHLRKRDFETELLTRLLNAGAIKRGTQSGPNAARPGPHSEPVRGVLGAVASSRSGLLAAAFLCIVCLLLLVGAGRTHSHTVSIGRAAVLQPESGLTGRPAEMLSHADVALGTQTRLGHLLSTRKMGPEYQQTQSTDMKPANNPSIAFPHRHERIHIDQIPTETIDKGGSDAVSHHERHRTSALGQTVDRKRIAGLRLMSFTIRPHSHLL